MKAIVVGAGIGGLCASILLAADGWEVDVFEQNEVVGGKLWAVEADGYRFSYGPSTLTMPDVFRRIVQYAGEEPDAYLPYRKLAINHRNFFANGQTLDAVTDALHMQEQISKYHAQDARNWPAYLRAAKAMYAHSVGTFFRRTFTTWRDYVAPDVMTSMLAIRPWQSLATFHRSYFRDANVLMSLDRYATYVGSRPEKAPAVLGMIGHLEFGDGVYYLEGGTVRLAQALFALAQKKGVRFHLGAKVTRVLIRDAQATGVVVGDSSVCADVTVVNADLLAAYQQLLDPIKPVRKVVKAQAQIDLAHSALVVLLGVKARDARWTHHNVLFPTSYGSEFVDMFDEGRLPRDGTVYLCNTSATDESDAPPGCSNLFMLLNAPARTDWNVEEVDRYVDAVLRQVSQRYDMPLTPEHIAYRQIVTPGDLAARTGAFRGSIYGPSSNRLAQAFLRPRMAAQGVRGLYFVGGSTHPGGGTPMVATSAILATRLIGQRLGQVVRGIDELLGE